MRCVRRLSIIVLAAVGLAVSGCANQGDGASVDEPQIRAVVAGYTAAVSAGDGAKGCDDAMPPPTVSTVPTF
jgi:hypothetical protein